MFTHSPKTESKKTRGSFIKSNKLNAVQTKSLHGSITNYRVMQPPISKQDVLQLLGSQSWRQCGAVHPLQGLENFNRVEQRAWEKRLFQRKEMNIPTTGNQGFLSNTFNPLAPHLGTGRPGSFRPPMQKKENFGQENRQINKTGMPDALKTGIENLSGIDISDVRVHYNSAKPPQVGALAYTQGTDIHVASGQERHLPHEAWHAVQQKQGRVQATTQAAGLPVNDNPALENEADVMGAKAVQMEISQSAISYEELFWGHYGYDNVVQRAMEKVSSSQEHEKKESLSVKPPETVFAEIDEKDVVKLSSAELVTMLTPLLKEFIYSIRYNSLRDASVFIDHLSEKRSQISSATVSPQEAYSDYSPDSVSAIGTKGAQCVGQAIGIIKFIKGKVNIPIFPVAAHLEGSNGYGHGAAIIKFSNPGNPEDSGYILLDPGFNVEDPIVVTAQRSQIVRNFVYKFNKSNNSIESHMNGKNDKLVATFPGQKVLNPESITKKALLDFKQFNIVARKKDGRIAMTLNLIEKKLEAFIFEGKKKTTLFSIMFNPENMEETGSIVNENISELLAKELGYKRDELVSELIKVIMHGSDILSLQNQ